MEHIIGDDQIMPKPKTDFTNISCCRCKNNKLNSKNAMKERVGVDRHWTGRWLCRNCYYKHRQNKFSSQDNENSGISNLSTDKMDKMRPDIIDKSEVASRRYNSINICDNIKEDDKRCENKLIPGKAFKEYKYEKGVKIWTGRWFCKSCYSKDYEKRPDSRNNLIKEVADFRTGNLDPNSESGKGYIFQQTTCITRRVKDLNIENNNFHSPIDHSIDSEYGILQSKGVVYDAIRATWHSNVENEHHKEFDYLIFYCISIDMKIIERIYIFPKEEIMKRKSIGIYKSPKRWIPWYAQYRLIDIKPYNDSYQEILKQIGEGKDTVLRSK